MCCVFDCWSLNSSDDTNELEENGFEPSSTPRHGTQIVVPKHRERSKNKALAFADQQMAELATMKNKWASV
jgi:hypothetical protein